MVPRGCFLLACFGIFRRIPHYPAHSDIFRLKLDGKDVQTMPDVKITDSPAQLDQILRPLGITRSSKNYRVLCECMDLICEQEDRLEAVHLRPAALQVVRRSERRPACSRKGLGAEPRGRSAIGWLPADRRTQRGAVPRDALQCRGERVTKRLPCECDAWQPFFA